MDEIPTFFVEEEVTIYFINDKFWLLKSFVTLWFFILKHLWYFFQDVDQETGEAEAADAAEPDFGLGVAQIVITAATPMIEDPEQAFPDEKAEGKETEGEESAEPEEEDANEKPKETPERKKQKQKHPRVSQPPPKAPTQPPPKVPDQPPPKVPDQPTHHVPDHPPPKLPDQPPPAIPEQVPPKASEYQPMDCESPTSPEQDGIQSPPKQVQGGRASIPDELEPHQLARLQDLKESNAWAIHHTYLQIVTNYCILDHLLTIFYLPLGQYYYFQCFIHTRIWTWFCRQLAFHHVK